MNAPRTLKEAVDTAAVHRGQSGRRMAALAQGHGYKITSTTLNAIRQGTYKSTPSTETLRAIAWLAGVSEESVFIAAGEPVPGPPFADELPPGVDNLSPKARNAIIEILRVLVDDQRGSDGNVSTGPITRAGESPAESNNESTQDDVDLATYETGRESQGRRLRRLQDEAAEAGEEQG